MFLSINSLQRDIVEMVQSPANLFALMNWNVRSFGRIRTNDHPLLLGEIIFKVQRLLLFYGFRLVFFLTLSRSFKATMEMMPKLEFESYPIINC